MNQFYRNRSGGMWNLGKAVQWILILNLGAFVVEALSAIWFRSSFFTDFLILGGQSLMHAKVWALFTYSILHGGLWHVFLNMLAVFFIGQMLEPLLGVKRFATVYIIAVLFGALAWLGINWGDAEYLVGASAGVFGILAMYCLMQPDRPITLLLFFVLPITIRPKTLLMVTMAIEIALFFFYELPDHTAVASSAHLGGIAAGFLCFELMVNRGWMSGRSARASSAVQKPKPSTGKTRFKVNITQAEELKKEVDRILDKISKDGFGSLTQKEKDTLDLAREMVRKD